jgi:hypothetical protein
VTGVGNALSRSTAVAMLATRAGVCTAAHAFNAALA